MIESLENIELLMDILEKEIVLVKAFTEVESTIMNSIIASNWDILESSISLTQNIALDIEKLDIQRAVCINQLRDGMEEDKSAHFYHLTVKLDSESKDKLNDLYRSLKLAVLNLQNINVRIDAYVGTVTGIMKQTLNEIYPNRRGNLYSRTGIVKEADSNPMVLNKKL